MKPKLLDKDIIYKYIYKNRVLKSNECNDSNINFFNFLLISLFIIGILFLIYRYLDKKKDKV